MKDNTPGAHLRRRDATIYLISVNLHHIVNYLAKDKDIHTNKHTVHRLLKAPRKNTRAGRRYKGLVNARIPRKNNAGERERGVRACR